MSMGWTSVHAGPLWEVELYQGRFDAEGIPTFVPDRNTKIMDPFATGAAPLMALLLVPPEHVEHANEVLATMRDEAEPEPHPHFDEVFGTVDDEEPMESRAVHEVERLGTRTRWAALMTITFPFAVAYGLLYVRASLTHGVRSRYHRLTIAALWFGLLSAGAFFALAVGRLIVR